MTGPGGRSRGTSPSRPGGALATRPLHFVWLADCSGSMAHDGKIQALNTAIRETLPHMRQVAADNPNAHVLVRVLRFASGASWHVAEPTTVEEFSWRDLDAGGVTDLGAALHLVADVLKVPPMSDRALPPVLVLVSDGQPTDDYEAGLQRLLAEPWGERAVRMAVAIGQDADRDVLEQFIATDGAHPLRANSPESLVRQIRWASTAALQSASAPAGGVAGRKLAGKGVPVPDDVGASSAEVW